MIGGDVRERSSALDRYRDGFPGKAIEPPNAFAETSTITVRAKRKEKSLFIENP